MKNKILIVDDDADIRRVVRGVLEPLAEIFEAPNGEEALRLIADEKPGLMVLDVSMAGMGGLAVLRAARRLVPSLPVLMLTGESDIEVAKSALDEGARAYITKPFDPLLLREEARSLLDASNGGASVRPDRPWSVRS